MTRRAGTLIAILTLGALATGCGSSDEQSEVQKVAVRFVGAASGDPAMGCQLLAPDTREQLEDDAEQECVKALPEAGIPSSRGRHTVTIAGHSAQVRFDDQTVFLARFTEGWRVTAAGCERETSDIQRPLTCEIDGG